MNNEESTVNLTFVSGEITHTIENSNYVPYSVLTDSIESNTLKWDFIDEFMKMTDKLHIEYRDIITDANILPDWIDVYARWNANHYTFRALQTTKLVKDVVDKLNENLCLDHPTIPLSLIDADYIMGDPPSKVKEEISELWDKIAEVLNK